jgi:hypothetical protein
MDIEALVTDIFSKAKKPTDEGSCRIRQKSAYLKHLHRPAEKNSFYVRCQFK